jgi:transketolase
MKYASWGWKVMTINGNNHNEIRQALADAQTEKERPVLIIGKTIMGKGLLDNAGNSFERKTSTHGMPVSDAGGSFEKSVLNLGGYSDNPFTIFDEVRKLYKNVLERKRIAALEWKNKKSEWAQKNPELDKKLHNFYSGNIPDIDFSIITHKADLATRAASANVLGIFANTIENMIVASADLANSDKTDGFLKNSRAFAKNDFSGAFLHAGVSELTMASLMNGMALHGGVIAACGTFFVFSDYMNPAIRLACLMELPVKYIWTHDAFRVGEDGPTHQPIEQEAQIRLMEHLKNHSGENSLLALRPADSDETTVAWKMALENKKTPTALILSRQNIKDLPSTQGNRFADALKSEKGAYIVADCEGTPEIILVANGSEVATLVESAALLGKNNYRARVVSAPSEGLFKSQPDSYRQSIIPDNIPVFGLTAGLSVTLQGLVGTNGIVLGMNSFGYSAPYKVLDEKFGFTAENVYNQIIAFLKNVK